MQRRLIVLALLAAAAGGWLLLEKPGSEPPSPGHQEPQGNAEPSRAAPGSDSRLAESRTVRHSGNNSALLQNQAYSLRGSDPDGQIRFDDFGQLVINRELRRRFDYLLTTSGELSLGQMRQLLSEQLDDHHSSMEIAQVLDEFDRYLNYLQAVTEHGLEPGSSLRQQLAELKQLQQHWLGSQRAEAWFGESNRYMARSLAILEGEIPAGEPDLDPWAEQLQAATGHHADVLLNREYRQQGIDPQQRYQERQILYGQAAADRLAALDAQRDDWQARLDHYRQHYLRLQQQPNLSASERAARLEQLRQQGFSEAEQRRLLALQQAGLLEDPGDGAR